MAHHINDSYYIPHGTRWPIIGSLGLVTMMSSAAFWLNDSEIAPWTFLAGVLILVFMLFGWFGEVIRESESGMYNAQVDTSFRLGMMWFIFSEVMFFAVFFGCLFYVRMFAVPWLGGEGTGAVTNELLWQGYVTTWPTAGPAELGGEFQTISAFGVPFVNTLILLSSGLTVTLAHLALKNNDRIKLVLWLLTTVFLGFGFVYLQIGEYKEAYQHLGLTLGSGIYGSTFFMLTGFHGVHVTLGAIMLTVIAFRSMQGHFKPENHFGFEAVAWYWH
ncbi:MAG: cytochrome c oxidase subunit 3, partial [Proteobacteria bacterium]|nr:cytochrome c oxidase subunit 3 [Pseudomonadota bacterium]